MKQFIQNKRNAIILKSTVSLGLTFLLIRQVDLTDTILLLRNVDLGLTMTAFILMVTQVVITAKRWCMVLHYQKINLNYKRTLQLLWIGLFFNQAMPSSVGGDVVRGYYLKKRGITLGRATLGVLLDRVFGMVGLVLLVICSLPLLFELVDNQVARWVGAIIAGGASVGIILLFFLDYLPGNFSHFSVVKGLYSLSKEGRACLVDGYRGLLVVLYSVVIHLFSILAVILIAEGLGVDVVWSGIVLMIPLVTLLMIVPVSIAGWGVREGGMVVGMGYLGVVPEQAFALSILYGLMLLAIALPGGLVWLAHRH